MRRTQSWLLAALCVCCTAALRLPAAMPPQCMQRPVAQQPLSTALRASAAQIRMQSADGAEGEVARRSGVSKGQLVDAISLRAGVSKKTAELVLSAALDVIVETVANGDKVTLVNFGTFDSKKREAREGRNPQTNKPMHIPASTAPTFKFGKMFKAMVKDAKARD